MTIAGWGFTGSCNLCPVLGRVLRTVLFGHASCPLKQGYTQCQKLARQTWRLSFEVYFSQVPTEGSPLLESKMQMFPKSLAYALWKLFMRQKGSHQVRSVTMLYGVDSYNWLSKWFLRNIFRECDICVSIILPPSCFYHEASKYNKVISLRSVSISDLRAGESGSCPMAITISISFT